MKELDHQSPTTKDPAPKATKPDPIDKDDVAANFQATIEQTLKRMQESKLESEKPRKSAEAEDDVLAQMFKAMSSQGTLPDPGGDDDFSKMLLTVMEQLTNKEILYEPMKEIHDGYPDWMVKHEATEKPEDMKRYREQQQVVSEIVARFERKEYSDESPEDREYIVERMQKVRFIRCLRHAFNETDKQLCRCKPPDLLQRISSAIWEKRRIFLRAWILDVHSNEWRILTLNGVSIFTLHWKHSVAAEASQSLRIGQHTALALRSQSRSHPGPCPVADP